MTNLTFLQLFRILKHHRNLSEKRSPIFESNKAAKWMVGIMSSTVVIYLVMFAIVFALGANASHRFTAMEYMVAQIPLVLIADFLARLMFQQTPSQLVKPYILLPVPRYVCIDSFILTSLLSWGNLLWFIMFVPFVLMSVCFSYGLLTSVSFLILAYLIILCSSQFYLICRTLFNNNIIWWTLPIGTFLAIFLPWILRGYTVFLRFYAPIATGIEHGNIIPHLGILAVLAVLIIINRRLQYVSVWQELGKQKVTKLKRVSEFSLFNRFDEVGEYLKLEIKLLMRNKNPRKTFLFAIVLVLLISMIIAFISVYDSQFMTNFWCFYCFAIFGGMLLIKAMSYEANYIETLFIHKENILKLLRAKYYFFCMLLLIPFVLMLPMVFMGKWNIAMLIAYGVFTAGSQYCLIMQMAVYNKQKIALNEKIVGKGGIENSYMQILTEAIAFFLPLAIIQPLEIIAGKYIAWGTMFTTGVIFIVTHKLWLNNIYRRMMKRKYKNLEAFINS
ncbi:MAG: hypothetical protein HXL33_04870 [Prevotellaceae bacterium]|nr:hypothetical protein [Prevotellaceae bacterium]